MEWLNLDKARCNKVLSSSVFIPVNINAGFNVEADLNVALCVWEFDVLGVAAWNGST